MPSRWPIAEGKAPITARDLAKRCFVTIAAITGGVVGGLLEMNALWDALSQALLPQRLFATLVVTTVTVALIGPLHEYVLDRGMDGRGPDPIPFGHALSAMWEHMSWRAAGRLGLVFLALVQVEAIYGSVHDSMREGNTQALGQVLLGGMEPGIISYYWCAALQYGAPSVRRTAFLPAMVAGAVMIAGYATFLVLWGIFVGGLMLFTGGPAMVALLCLVAAPMVGAAVLVVFPGVTVAPYSLAGGWAIDRVRGSEPTFYLLLALLAATIPQEIVVMFLYHLFDYAPTVSDEVSLFIGTALWVLGLWASGFPGLVKRGAQAPDEPRPLEAPEPYPTEP